jgi:hypothetical protein
LVHGYQNLWFKGIKKTFSQKKEDIKMDDQIKIKILKSFDHIKIKKVWDYKGTTSSLNANPRVARFVQMHYVIFFATPI